LTRDTQCSGNGAAATHCRLTAVFSALFLLVAWAGHALLPALPVGSLWLGALLGLGLLLLFLVAALGLILSVVRLELGPWVQLGGAAAAAGLVLATRKLGLAPLADYLVVVAASLFGCLVARLIREPNLLVPVAVVAGLVDFWGVYWGFVAHISKTAPQVVQSFSSAVPTPAATGLPLPGLSAMGIGDFLFTALYLGAVWRLGMRTLRTARAIFVAVLFSPLAFWLVPLVTHRPLEALPGLPFIGAGLLVANWRDFRISREEKFALLWAALVAGVVVGLYLLLRRAF